MFYCSRLISESFVIAALASDSLDLRYDFLSSSSASEPAPRLTSDCTEYVTMTKEAKIEN
jgi:hypothetical protein